MPRCSITGVVTRLSRFPAVVLAALVLALPPGVQAVEVGDDGLHKQPWFSVTFKDIADDIEEANAAGKRLALVFEQRGCIYCEKMHEVLLADPDISAYLQEHFMIVQYNLFGDEEVVDLDGEALSEKRAAEKWQVLFTPTILFMPDAVPEGLDASKAAVAVMPGTPGKQTFLNMFRWVQAKGYDTDEHFQKFHARMLGQREQAQ